MMLPRNFVENSVVEAIREDLLEEMVKMDLVNRDWSLKKAQGICFTGFEPLTNTPSFKYYGSKIENSPPTYKNPPSCPCSNPTTTPSSISCWIPSM